MKPLISEEFKQDPAVTEAKETLLALLAKHQQKINAVRPADPDRKQSYEKTLDAFSEARGGKLYYPYLGSGMGNGPFVELMDGSVKYDFINGIGVHHFGHSNPKIIEACLDAALEDTVMQGNLQQNELAFTFSKKLLDLANKNNAGIDHCFLSSTGVMAIENALKFAFQKNAPAARNHIPPEMQGSTGRPHLLPILFGNQ